MAPPAADGREPREILTAAGRHDGAMPADPDRPASPLQLPTGSRSLRRQDQHTRDNTSATASQRIGNLVGIATPRRCKDGHALMIIPTSQRRCRINDDGASDCLGRRKTTQNSTLTGKGGDRRCKAELGIVTFARFDAIAATKPDGRGCAARPVQNAHVFKMPQRAVSPGRYRQAYIDLGRGRKTAWRTDYITWADVVARHISQVDGSTTAGVDILPVDAMGLKTADDHRSAYRRHDCL